jgi:prepilin-type N-terminal cleavage/methylation domain-containing protein/prepilin-type processing-associated H-X9-DG protein
MSIPPSCGNTIRIKPKGFTLTEVLVVITIIVVLAALSTLGFVKIRSAARGATCTSNLRQIGAAMISYASDKNGQLPPLEDRTGSGDGLKGIWTQILADGDYLPRVQNSIGKHGCGAGVWACPDCTDVRGTGKVETNFNGYGAAEGTVLQVKKGTQPNSGSFRLAQIPKPERTWLVGDAANNSKNLKTGWYAIWANPQMWTGGHAPAARHAGKINVCMVDGHVESLTNKELQAPGKDYTMFKP